MQSSIRKVVVGALFFVASCIVAIIGYMLAGWSLLEALYMVTFTIFGVGDGEVRPTNDPTLRVFTEGVIIAGCTSSIYVMGGFVQMVAEGELNRFLGSRRMTRGIENLTKHAIGEARIARLITRPSAEEILSSSFHQDTLTEDLEQIGLQMTELRVPANSDGCDRHSRRLRDG